MATYYIDPKASSGGTGTISSPFQLFASLPTLVAGDIVLQKKGTVSQDTISLSNVTASASNPIIFDCYGDGNLPVVNANNAEDGSCFEFTNCDGITIQNYQLTGASDFPGGGVRIIDSDNIVISFCTIFDTYYGVRAEVTGASPKEGLTILNCKIQNTQDSWILAVSSTVAGGTYSNILIKDNLFSFSGQTGISIQSREPSDVITSDHVIYNVAIINNVLDTTAAYGAFLKGIWASSNNYGQNKFHNNIVRKTGFGGGRDTHAIWHGGNQYWTIDNNLVEDTYVWANNLIGSGVGVYIDVFSSSQGCQYMKVTKNRFFRCGQGITKSIIGGAAIGVLRGADILISENLGVSCRNGIFVQGASSAPDTIRVDVENNTMINNDGEGSAGAQYAAFSQAKLVKIRNNIGLGGKLGLYKQTVSGAVTSFTETHNLFYGQSVLPIGDGNGTFLSPGTGTTPDVSDVLTNPLLTSFFSPSSISPAIEAGTYLGVKQDINYTSYYIPPTIGAYEYIRPRTMRS